MTTLSSFTHQLTNYEINPYTHLNMKLKTTTLALTAMSLTLIGTASAERVFGLGGERPAPIDAGADGDGTVTDEEREAARSAREEARAAARAAREEARQAIIDEFDVDEDGVLNEEERAAAKAAREAERAAAKAERFAEIDGEAGDGEISLEELQAAHPDSSDERVAAVFARLDTDLSTTVSLEEFTNPEPRERRVRGASKGRKKVLRQGRRGRVAVIRGFRGGRGAGGDDGGAGAPDPTE